MRSRPTLTAPRRELRCCFRLQLVEALPRRGGVLGFDREVSRRDVVRFRVRLMLRRPIGKGAVGVARSAARARLETLHLMRGLDRRAGDKSHETRPMASAAACASAGTRAFSGDLDQFDAWMETAYADYRM